MFDFTLKKAILMICLLFSFYSSSAFSETKSIGCKNFTPDQCSEIQSIAKVDKDMEPVPVSRNFSEYSNLAADLSATVADTLIETASRLGVEVNKFSETKVGKMIVFYLFWKIIGISIFSFVCKAIGTIISLIILTYSKNSLVGFFWPYKLIKTDRTNFFGRQIYIKEYHNNYLSGEEYAGRFLLELIYFVVIAIYIGVLVYG